MNKRTLANALNGREYGEEMTKAEEQHAKDNGLVVIFGASDDLIELRGAIEDEVGAYDGGTVYINKDGIVEDCEEPCDHCKQADAKLLATAIDAVWSYGEYSWYIKPKENIQFAEFDIMESETPFCRGIIIDLSEL